MLTASVKSEEFYKNILHRVALAVGETALNSDLGDQESTSSFAAKHSVSSGKLPPSQHPNLICQKLPS
jgi:hypothetical protein